MVSRATDEVFNEGHTIFSTSSSQAGVKMADGICMPRSLHLFMDSLNGEEAGSVKHCASRERVFARFDTALEAAGEAELILIINSE